MIYEPTKAKIEQLTSEYHTLSAGQEHLLHDIALAEIPEMVYNSNAIENSTLTLEDTEDILIRDQIKKDADIREVYEAKNLAKITEMILDNPSEPLSIDLILRLHSVLLTGINDSWAGHFRSGREWVRVGTHIGANPRFIPELMGDLVDGYNEDTQNYFLGKIAHFHAEFETIHPFRDGNGRLGRLLVNQQLVALGYPPIIIRSKGKKTDYYPLFDVYQTHDKSDGFTNLFASLLLESLHKRITMMTAKKVITVNEWAKIQGANVNSALNKAKRQTIPAFRKRETWMISAGFRED